MRICEIMSRQELTEQTRYTALLLLFVLPLIAERSHARFPRFTLVSYDKVRDGEEDAQTMRGQGGQGERSAEIGP